MTPDIIKAIADVLDAYGAANGYLAHEEMADANERLCDARELLAAALGLDDHATYLETTAALRALARPDVGLPEGWTIDSDGEATNGLICVDPDGAKGIWIDGRWAPAEVVRAVLLRAAGVAP